MSTFDHETFNIAVHKAVVEQLEADGISIHKHRDIIASVLVGMATVGQQVAASFTHMDRRVASTDALVEDLDKRLAKLERADER